MHGELRDSYGFTWTLGGTLATRAQQKRRNARLERLLLRDVEPWAAVSWLALPSVRSRAPSAEGSITLAQLPAFLLTAWQELLEAQRRTKEESDRATARAERAEAVASERQRLLAELMTPNRKDHDH